MTTAGQQQANPARAGGLEEPSGLRAGSPQRGQEMMHRLTWRPSAWNAGRHPGGSALCQVIGPRRSCQPGPDVAGWIRPPRCAPHRLPLGAARGCAWLEGGRDDRHRDTSRRPQ